MQSDRIADAATVLPFCQRDFRSLVGARLRLTLVKRSSQYGSVYHRLGAAARDSDFAASSRAAEKRHRAKASLVQREVGPKDPEGLCFFNFPFSTSLARRRRRAFSVTFDCPKVTKGHRGRRRPPGPQARVRPFSPPSPEMWRLRSSAASGSHESLLFCLAASP